MEKMPFPKAGKRKTGRNEDLFVSYKMASDRSSQTVSAVTFEGTHIMPQDCERNSVATIDQFFDEAPMRLRVESLLKRANGELLVQGQ